MMAVSELSSPAEPTRLLALIPTFWPRQGGAQMVVAAIASGLRARVECSVLTRGYAGSPKYEDREGMRIVRYGNGAPEPWKDYATGSRSVPFPAKACVALLDVIGAAREARELVSGSDLVHVHFPLPLGVSALAAQRKVKRPLVVTVHGNADVYELPRIFTPLTVGVLKRADAVVSVSRDLAERLGELGVRNVRTIPNGVDTHLFSPSSAPRPAAFTLVSISRIVPRKNVGVLVEAVLRLAARGHEVRLIVAGRGPSEAEIARKAAESGGVVEFVGFVDEAKKRQLLAGADAFVQLSTREGLSIATLEALATGLVCVVSDLPGVREPVDPGKTGFLVPDPERVESVTQVLENVLGARSRLSEMKRAARKAAVARYSLEAMAEGYFEVYQRVLRGAPP
jgi:glycosyltransferase involved in cell wall biosynthesis